MDTLAHQYIDTWIYVYPDTWIQGYTRISSNLLRVPHGSKSFTNVSARIWNVLSNIIDFDVPISKLK